MQYYIPQISRYFDNISAKRYKNKDQAARDGYAPEDLVAVYPLIPYVSELAGRRIQCFRANSDNVFFIAREELK